MVSAKREPIRGFGGLAPNGVQGQSPWSGGLGDFVPQKLTLLRA